MVTTFTKAGENMVWISGDLCDRVRDWIDYDYSRWWCGFTLLGKDGRKILVMKIYNMSQHYDTGMDTLYWQKKGLYLSTCNIIGITEDNHIYICPKIRFVKDLRTLLENPKAKRQDVIMTGDFNEDFGDNLYY